MTFRGQNFIRRLHNGQREMMPARLVGAASTGAEHMPDAVAESLRALGETPDSVPKTYTPGSVALDRAWGVEAKSRSLSARVYAAPSSNDWLCYVVEFAGSIAAEGCMSEFVGGLAVDIVDLTGQSRLVFGFAADDVSRVDILGRNRTAATINKNIITAILPADVSFPLELQTVRNDIEETLALE